MHMNLASIVKTNRLNFGWSQTELANKAGISLPTIQNIELGKANPCLDVIEKVTIALGLDFLFTTQKASWDYLIAFGLPLFMDKGTRQIFRKDEWIKQIYLAANELSVTSEQKKVEALAAY